MPDFIARQTLDNLESLVRDLHGATVGLQESLQGLRDEEGSAAGNPETFVKRVLELDEQISRIRLLLPLCTNDIGVSENGRTLPLSDVLVELRSEFDSLARAQLEVLLDDAE